MLSSLIQTCVHRRLPVLAVIGGIAAYGVFAYNETAIEAFPDVTNIAVRVIAQMPGQAPEEIERQVTIPLERVLNGTPGMIQMRSESLFGLSLVFLTFEDGTDGYRARTIVTEKLNEADLPEGVSPVLSPDDTPLGEIYQYRLVSDRHTPEQVRSEQEWNVSRILRQVPGVADVVNFGGYLKEIHVLVDTPALIAHGLTLQDLCDAIQRSNHNVGGGFLRHGDQELVIRGVGYLSDPHEIGQTVLKNEDGTPVTVGDVARLVVSHTPRRGNIGYNEAVDVTEGFVLLRRGENPSRVLEGVHAKVGELNDKILPKGMKIEPFYDRTTLVDLTLSTVHHSLLFGALLVAGVVWLFLRSLRCSLIVASVIPLALLTAFIGLRWLGLPANLISMGAIDFGILVDGAVVLVENVLHETATHRPQTAREMLSLIAGAALDVASPTFFAMAIIIAALMPVFTLERIEGRIFRPLAMTYSFALAGALVFALTAVPALCAVLLRARAVPEGDPKFLVVLRAGYRRALAFSLAHRWAIGGGAVVLAVLGGAAVMGLGSEFLPELDEGDFVIFVEMPPSISLEKGQEVLTDVRRRLQTFPEVIEVLSEQGRPEDGTDDEGVNMSETFVHLKPHEAWRHGVTKDKLIEEMRASLTEIPGVDFNFSQPIKDNVEEAITGVRGKVVLKIFGTDLEAMRDTLEAARTSLSKVRGIVDLELYRDATVPQLNVTLDRKALARAGITVGAAEDVLETALAGRVVTEMWEGERPIPVRVMLPETERGDPEAIGAIAVPAVAGSRPLRDLARVSTDPGRACINREANSRVLALKFNVDGRDMGGVVKDAMAVVDRDVKVPPGHFLTWGGEFENQARAMRRLGIVVPISALIVFALLYMGLQSARSAAVVIGVTPFALTGGAMALLVCGINLSVSAAVGFIALLGQVCLAALLVMSAIDARRRAGVPLREAIVEGATGRLRAVLMTALLAILGLTPMALSRGVGSEIQRPFALVIIGGLVTSIAVVLFVLPVAYATFGSAPLPVPEEGDPLA
ncbi:MAG TPA: CusA/CzcA family heavy metal efflux RND transporter [Candidatus Polarisedimenticolaceae bacterium]|nr:CusA/CzcA family heavy metal efflux RND transporter [Candidatus Polarisedimenticolaceae bacterium]